MLYSEAIISRKGPLARVWLAAHWERKISKNQFLQTNIEKTVDAITAEEQELLTLRLSGQLLLGIVRIYSRKTRYLLEDCNDALVKIKTAFKKGDVDMPDTHRHIANINAITLSDDLTEFDILLPEAPLHLNRDPNEPIMDLSLSMSNISRRQDITISQSGNDAQLLSLGFNDNILDGIESGRDLFQHGAESDLQLADLGLNDMNEIEMGRDAALERSLTMDDIGAPLERMNIKDTNNEEFDFDLGPEPDFLPEPMPDERQPDSSFDLPDASMTTESNSALIPDTQAIGDDLLFDVGTPSAQANTPQIHRRRLIIDKVTELPHNKIRDQINDTSDIVTEATFLPTSSEMLRFKSIEKQGIKFFINLNAPLNLAPELQTLFTRGRKRSPSITSIDDEDDEEHQRKQPKLITGPATGTRANADEDEYDIALGAGEEATTAAAKTTVAKDVPETQAGIMPYEANVSPVTSSSSQLLSPLGISKQTTDTMERLQATFDQKKQTAEEPKITYQQMAGQDIKRADAVKLFFDVLVLSTKDMVKVKQSKPYGDITISQAVVA
ncbi:Rec8 like protein-domain-containing protein [Umbelopsis sp. PMI_123]|nr:Rec8 like protein-domain-containing protein [Umbelopsis sp. PMI_123]